MRMAKRYSLSKLIRAIRRPSLLYFELHKLMLDFNIRYQNVREDHTGFNPLNADWDNLIILDACRYDMFEELNSIEGDLRMVKSPASESWEYLSKCFNNREIHDTIYITANPHAIKLEEGTFFSTFNLLYEEWDSELETVPPDAMVRKAKKVFNDYPDKRLIIHFMQPHFPFIGDFGEHIEHSGINPDAADDNAVWEPNSIWSQLRYGRVDEKVARKAYRENLKFVLPYVEELVTFLPGKSVVTSDHGNMVGERTNPLPARAYGHPHGLRASELNNVPWLEISFNERREVTTEPPQVQQTYDSDIVNDRLKSLGYK